jgi:hypothetical protein
MDGGRIARRGRSSSNGISPAGFVRHWYCLINRSIHSRSIVGNGPKGNGGGSHVAGTIGLGFPRYLRAKWGEGPAGKGPAGQGRVSGGWCYTYALGTGPGSLVCLCSKWMGRPVAPGGLSDPRPRGALAPWRFVPRLRTVRLQLLRVVTSRARKSRNLWWAGREIRCAKTKLPLA